MKIKHCNDICDVTGTDICCYNCKLRIKCSGFPCDDYLDKKGNRFCNKDKEEKYLKEQNIKNFTKNLNKEKLK